MYMTETAVARPAVPAGAAEAQAAAAGASSAEAATAWGGQVKSICIRMVIVG